LALYLAVHHYLAQRSVTTGAETVAARTETFVKIIRLTGTTAAVHARPILVPTLEGAQLSQLVITKLAPAGTRVRKGDVLAEFDRQAQLKDALTKRGTYQDLVDQVVEKRAAEAAARAKDETELKQGQDDLTKARLEVSKNDIVSHIDAEKNRETLAEAEATLKQLQQTFKLKREAAAADIRSVAIQADRAKETMLYAESNAQRMRILSPMDGVVVLNMVWTGSRVGEVQQGDDVRPGLPFMKVVDPSVMNVSVQVNQADFLSLHVGQRARVYLDAYPSLEFSGQLEELSPMAHTAQFSDTVRTFSATFAIDGNNSKLMPDLSAAVDVELDSRKNAVVVPVESVESKGDHEYVWIRDGDSFTKRRVETGPRNDLDVVIESGLKSGEMVKRDAVGPVSAGIS
jgi:RND family efflux transporter MFP subunit